MADLVVESCTIVKSPTGAQTLNGYGYRAAYRIVTNEPASGNLVALFATVVGPDPLPRIRDPFTFDGNPDTPENDPAVECSNIEVVQEDEKKTVHIASVQWNTPTQSDQNQPPDRNTDPLNRAPVWRADWDIFTVPRENATCDIDISWHDGSKRLKNVEEGKGPVTNAAGFKYGREWTEQVRRPVLIYQKHVDNAFDHIRLQKKYGRKTNDAAWDAWGLPASEKPYQVPQHAGLVWYFTSTGPQYWKTTKYWTFEARIIVDEPFENLDYPGLWQMRVENMGNKFWEDPGTTPGEPIPAPGDEPRLVSYQLDDRNHPVPPPFPLTARGRYPLSTNSNYQTDATKAVDFLTFKDREHVSFAQMMNDINDL